VTSDHQPSLFAQADLTIDPDFRSAIRCHLDDYSCVEFVPGWVSGTKLYSSVSST
jgi:hypothetical protein